jgi:uncharacterized Zn finger protein/superfamily II DNA or RNA helicase
MANYGRTWWGKKWLETFTGIDEDNRLPRGRTYANTGRAYNVHIRGNTITAKVTGSRPEPYKVVIRFNPFTQLEQEAIEQMISSSPAILSALISKRLPEQLLEKLHTHKIKLFPSQWKEIKASCSCPDWAMPCKHIAAVIYLIGAEIDKDPFVVFHIHNCNLLNLIGDFNEGKLADAQKIVQFEDIFKPSAYQYGKGDESTLHAINLAKIPDLSGQIKSMLRDDPLFYPKNFRGILDLFYKHWQRHPSKRGQAPYFYPVGAKTKGKKALSEEERFTEKWQHPENWESFQLTINDNLHLIKIFNGDTELFSDTPNLTLTLIRFLEDIPNAVLHKLCPALRFLHMLSQFAHKLLEKSACIPQILQNSKEEVCIRWIPALFDHEVMRIYEQLCATCLKEIINYQNIFLSPEEQVKTATALIISGYMTDNVPLSFYSHKEHEVFQLFFAHTSYRFNTFANKALPAAINQWLSNLYLFERQHKIYLMIEDKQKEFELALKVSIDNNDQPLPLHTVLQSKDPEVRLAILADLSMIFEYIPQLEGAIDGGTNAIFYFDDFVPLFLEVLPLLKAIGIGMILPKSLQKILKPQLSLNLKTKDVFKDDQKSVVNLENLLDFDWKIAIGDKRITFAEFKNMLQKSRGMIRLINEYVFLDEKEMQALLKQIEKLPERLSQADLMQAALAGEFSGAHVDMDDRLDALFTRWAHYNPVNIPLNLNAQLRPYQERGFSWLVQNIDTGFGSILADDMGLGKTLQVITTILYLKNKGILDTGYHVLVIAPTSLLGNWQREIEKFAPDLSVGVYHGQNRELKNEYDVLITSYGLTRRDKKELNKIKWFLLVIDEAQNIKNPNAEQTKAIKSIEAQHKIAMSGTPVENRLLDYWSVFDFTNKHYLGTPKQFKERYASPIEKERNKDCLERFKKVTSPFILRRLKSDKNIIQDLPEKIENNHYCSLTAEQAALYQEMVTLSIKKIECSQGIERKGLVLKLINALKQICNHPSQFAKKKLAHIEQSGKMGVLEQILLQADNTAEKSLIFTQYTQMGEIIAKLLAEKWKTPLPFLHGGLSRKARDQIIDQFENLSNVRTLIVSLKAGGTGLNLTAASHVIHYDLWWNPAVEAQATDRAYRIGQQRNVWVHRLLTMGTFEERIDEMIKSKKELANLTVGSGENWITEMSTAQIIELVSLK